MTIFSFINRIKCCFNNTLIYQILVKHYYTLALLKQVLINAFKNNNIYFGWFLIHLSFKVEKRFFIILYLSVYLKKCCKIGITVHPII